MKEFFMETLNVQYAFRILLAGICGIIIGLERKNRSKEAGIRTHFVVACGAALMMIVSKYGFFDIIKEEVFSGADVRLDPSRIASTIASGIGFLGAGMIFVHRNTITGLTTAAGIWATSGVGMAIGAGLYSIGVFSTLLILFAQIVLHLNFKWIAVPRTKQLIIKDVDRKDYQEYIMGKFAEKRINVRGVSLDNDVSTNLRKFTFIVEIPSGLMEEEIISEIEYNASIKSSL